MAAENKALILVIAPVNDGRYIFCVIYNDIMTTTYTVNGTHDTLVTVVKKESVFLLHKSTSSDSSCSWWSELPLIMWEPMG